MKSWKIKIIVLMVLVGLGFLTKFILWDYNVSSGKRVGNLTKISKKGKLIKTWEGTIDEGSGDKLTSYFSVESDKLGKQLYQYEGRQVIIYYNEHFLGWPRDTNYNVVAWKPNVREIAPVDSDGSDLSLDRKTKNDSEGDEASGPATKELSKSLFCALLGGLYKDQELYQQVKTFVKKDNLYLYRQYQKCND